jgi:hypothetical protein
MATVCHLFHYIRLSMKRDITEFVSQKCRSKYYTVNKLPFLIKCLMPKMLISNLFAMYAKARFQIRQSHTICMVPIGIVPFRLQPSLAYSRVSPTAEFRLQQSFAYSRVSPTAEFRLQQSFRVSPIAEFRLQQSFRVSPTAEFRLQQTFRVSPTAEFRLQQSFAYSRVSPTAEFRLQPSFAYSQVSPTAEFRLQPSFAYCHFAYLSFCLQPFRLLVISPTCHFA